MARVQTDRIGRTKKREQNGYVMYIFPPSPPKFYYFLLYTITQMHRRYSAGHTWTYQTFFGKSAGPKLPHRNGNWAIGRKRDKTRNSEREEEGGYGYARLNRKEKDRQYVHIGEDKKRKSGASHTNRKV